MTKWGRRRVALVVLVALVTIVIALALSGQARGIALYAYLLFLVLLAAVTIGGHIRSAWPATPRFDALVPRRDEPEARVLQLEGLVGRLAGGHPNAFDLYHRIRPMVRQIVLAQLSRGAGVDLESHPERAERYVGPWTWELIRPDLEPPLDGWTRTWSPRELEALVTELEALR
jgi:hypothetical protein